MGQSLACWVLLVFLWILEANILAGYCCFRISALKLNLCQKKHENEF